MQKTRVLFVCLGNICRSPTAEGVFRQHVQRQGWQEMVEFDSCGTHNYHPDSAPDARATEHARKRGIDLTDLRARQVQKCDFSDFDLILAADRENMINLKVICPPEHVHKLQLMLDFSSRWRGKEVPDPYYGGADGFEHVLDMLEDMAVGLGRRLTG